MANKKIANSAGEQKFIDDIRPFEMNDISPEKIAALKGYLAAAKMEYVRKLGKIVPDCEFDQHLKWWDQYIAGK